MQKDDLLTVKRFSIVVTGRVQGVGYRFYAKENAEVYGLTGWVSNCFDGSVEIEAQGKEETLEQFCNKLKKGPLLGHISDVRIKEIEPLSEEDSFTIRFY